MSACGACRSGASLRPGEQHRRGQGEELDATDDSDFQPWLELCDGLFFARLGDSIPPLRGVGLALRECDADALTLVMPLARNHNDKGTAFAGSIATLALIAGWAVAQLSAEALGQRVQTAATRCELDFQRPLGGDLVARCAWPPPAQRRRLARTLSRHGLARLSLQVAVGEIGAVCAPARIDYAIRVVA